MAHGRLSSGNVPSALLMKKKQQDVRSKKKLKKQKELYQTIQVVAGVVFGVALFVIVAVVLLKYYEGNLMTAARRRLESRQRIAAMSPEELEQMRAQGLEQFKEDVSEAPGASPLARVTSLILTEDSIHP